MNAFRRVLCCFALLLCNSWLITEAKIKGYQPVDVGFQFATPINLANTLQNSIAGPLSVVAVVIFGAVLLAGLFTPAIFARRSFDPPRFAIKQKVIGIYLE